MNYYKISGEATINGVYFSGIPKIYIVGVLVVIKWGIRNFLNLFTARMAGVEIFYSPGQITTRVAALWDDFIWNEFTSYSKGTKILLGLMFMIFLARIISIIYSIIDY